MPGAHNAGMRSNLLEPQDPLGVASRRVVTFATGKFIALAKRYRLTPETLALVAMEKYVEKAPEVLELISDYPLVNRPCSECVLQRMCVSARSKNRAVCFL
jgi:hypothetical protein